MTYGSRQAWRSGSGCSGSTSRSDPSGIDVQRDFRLSLERFSTYKLMSARLFSGIVMAVLQAGLFFQMNFCNLQNAKRR